MGGAILPARGGPIYSLSELMNSILRPGLLEGIVVRLEPATAELTKTLTALGAQVTEAPAPAEPACERLDALIVDCSIPAEPPGEGSATGADPLVELLQNVWEATAAAANGSFIPAGRGGRILLIAPPARSRPFASAAGAALENLARTLSVEWARHAITTVALAPGPGTDPEQLATVVAYLLSPAGAYFSGTRLDLDALRS